MSGPPPLPPLPSGYNGHSAYGPSSSHRHNSSTPALPPLPPGALAREQQMQQSYQPGAIVAPKPQRMLPTVPGQMARSIEGDGYNQYAPSSYGRATSPAPPPKQAGLYGSPGGGFPQMRVLSPAPSVGPPVPGAYPYGSPSLQPGQHLRPQSLADSPNRPLSAAPSLGAQMQAGYGQHSRPYSLSYGEPVNQNPGFHPGLEPRGGGGVPHSYSAQELAPPQIHGAHPGMRRASSSDAMNPMASHADSGAGGGPPNLNAPMPDMNSLASIREKAFASGDERRKLAWAKQLIKFVGRKHTDGAKISDPKLVQWIDEAIKVITKLANVNPPEPEALYMRGDLLASGSFPTYLPKNLKSAFNDFELAARMGWAASWFRIGRDYEVLGDIARARDAYERGISAGDVGSIYRLGMANLLGQLDQPPNPARAIPMLRDAADRADLETPQPAYIYGMLLAGEFNHVEIPRHLLVPSRHPVNPGAPVTLEAESRRRIERAAYLNFAPAQYKCGWSYEYAQLDCPFDPLLSVQYYSLASQGGEIEADMALSKWFLCGAEGCFEKNEGLAFTFAEKAARKGLASAEFALAYYHEVGVGTEKNIEVARKWYRKAASHGNTDAKERLEALDGPAPSALSRVEHEAHIDNKLQRKRTQAKMLSDREGRANRHPSNGGGSAQKPAAADLSRKRTMRLVEETAGPSAGKADGPRRGRRSMIPEGSEASMASNATARQGSRDRIPSGPASYRQNSGYSLSETYATPTGLTSTPPPAHPPAPQSRPSLGPPGQSNTPSNLSGGSSAASSSTTSENKKVYNTFAEMGFQPQKKDEKECVIC